MPPTHEPYLHLLPSCKVLPPFGWYSLRLPAKGWPGWVDLTHDRARKANRSSGGSVKIADFSGPSFIDPRISPTACLPLKSRPAAALWWVEVIHWCAVQSLCGATVAIDMSDCYLIPKLNDRSLLILVWSSHLNFVLREFFINIFSYSSTLLNVINESFWSSYFIDLCLKLGLGSWYLKF